MKSHMKAIIVASAIGIPYLGCETTEGLTGDIRNTGCDPIDSGTKVPKDSGVIDSDVIAPQDSATPPDSQASCDGGDAQKPTCGYAIVQMIPKGTVVCEPKQAIDLCTDVIFSVAYKPGTLTGITDVLFDETTEDTCGYLSTSNGGIIGMQKKWVVKQILGEQPYVTNLWKQIGNDKLISEVYMRDQKGDLGSIVLGVPESATKIKVTLNETYDGSAGLDYYMGNGVFHHEVKCWGQSGNVGQGREHEFSIQTPTVMPYNVPHTLETDVILGTKKVSKEEYDSLSGSQ